MLWRRTTQPILPPRHSPAPAGRYDLYPAYPLPERSHSERHLQQIGRGFAALAECLAGHPRIVIDGYGGVLWPVFRERLERALVALEVKASWLTVDQALKPEAEIARLVAPFLGDDPLFGTRFTGSLKDFFDQAKLKALRPGSGVSILYGTGAALAGWSEALLLYLDVPKNEIQYRARAGSIANLGRSSADDPKVMYKQCYFVDWVVLNRHKAELLPHLDLIVDAQNPDDPAFMTGERLRAGLERMAHTFFRARPWFEPGPWGGQWLKKTIPALAQDAPNYAWSFELITPENGLIFESASQRLEVSFDLLMYQNHRAVLGDSAERFGYDFPIRFDYLDTFEGGNLSLQCHPRADYIRQFGERFTQDETYYIMDAKPGAKVYLGFRDGIDPQGFEQALSGSLPLEVEAFVMTVPARQHALYLIPSGTIHCSGQDALVLEISATPYIFTFKLYDWLRPDLDGRPRPLNVARAMANLDFQRQGQRVHHELISQPRLLVSGPGWQVVHLPTHQEHFYDVHRLEFDKCLEVATEGSVHVLTLVAGEAVLLETGPGAQQLFSYAETFVVPAAANAYRLTNRGAVPAKVIKAFIKPGPQP
ncbi:MAG: class I mannose-6-phosphate isomerase [Truepera sp.]|nr:class I mannose-6-phosphate isomerase [Truepera sp.]